LYGLLCALIASNAYSLNLTVNGVNKDGTVTLLTSYRWVIEEDTTYHPEDTNFTRDINTLGLSFHASYMPVVATGTAADIGGVALDPAKHYFVSVLPDPTTTKYSIGGAQIAPGQTDVTISVNANPIPTAQITFFVFEDDFPLNNSPDLPEEEPCVGNNICMDGFAIQLEDAGGSYGASAGRASKDAFGNPIGTTYLLDADGNLILDADGLPTVDVLGDGVVYTGPDGRATIKYLAPGKYGTIVVPPEGMGWQQTTTIEGTKVIDAWVKADEPPFFAEFGPPGEHVFVGFIRPFTDTTVLTGGTTLSGQIVNNHMSRPPDYTFYRGFPFDWTTAWVGLNDLNQGAIGKAVYAQPTNNNGKFNITGVPAGNYELAVFDSNLDLVIALLPITVNPDLSCSTPTGSCNLSEVSVFNWFARMESTVFSDLNQNGFRDQDINGVLEPGIPDQTVNLRWRSGNLYQTAVTDSEGYVPFDQVFPFFHWLVAEVDFARFKATGATFVVDAGGPVLPHNGWVWPSFDVLTPQAQCVDDGTGTGATVGYDPATGTCPGGSEAVNLNTPDNNNLSRTEVGPVLTQGFQAFLGQTNVIQWAKATYGTGENGGISGIVYYATTRAEDDPELGVAEPWEAGIPRVQVNLYQDANWDGIPDTTTPILTTTTDSWDDSQPTGCQGEIFYGGQDLNGDGVIDATDLALDTTGTAVVATDCYDGLRNFNQLRPGVFDGGYAFGPSFDCVADFGGTCPSFVTIPDPINAPTSAYLATGIYIVETVPPAGYEIVKSQDKNVDFGDDYTPSALLTPPVCVNWADVDGDTLPGYTVPAELALFPGVPAPLAGQQLPLCDQKQVILTDTVNGAADFYLFTETPIAAHFVGMILDDTANEFNPASPQFGEKYAPPFVPVSFRDWTGREIVRVYADEWGRYNGLVPSTYTQNLPLPSGTSPNMLTACMNDAGPILDTRVGSPTLGQMITDPNFNRQYSQFCYTFQYMPGITTYLDTPVVPVSAFAGPDQFQLDCELPSATPRIYSVSGPLGGPFVMAAGDLVTITSMGSVEVPNPAYDGPNGTQPKTIMRDYGFGGTAGTVSVGGAAIDPANVIWAADGGSISFAVPDGLTTGELIVTRADGTATPVGVTLWVNDPKEPYVVHQVQPSTDPLASPIQDAIDLAGEGDIILIAPGNYAELTVMWKPVRLQGWGEGSVTLNASQSLSNRLLDQRQTIAYLLDPNGDGDPKDALITLLEAQQGLFDPNAIEPNVLRTEEGAAILVLGDEKTFEVDKAEVPLARIDGLTITGASGGGGIMVNGYANDLEISNNVVVGNQGFFGGGIRVGHPELLLETNQGLVYQDSFNARVQIHHNRISQNGGLGGTGGGVSLHTGADDYAVVNNFICGNFTMGEGGGVGHLGLVEDGKDEDTYGGVIANNQILFNQNFNQSPGAWNGGGVFITGGPPADPAVLLSTGSGSVLINANLLQGNLAGAGDGGAISLLQVNGADVEASKKPEDWYTADLFNNMIVNNVAGLAGGAIALKDVTRSNILHNTVAFNDSTATAGLAFTPGFPNQSNPQPAGIVSRPHSDVLFAVIDEKVEPPFNAAYANPRMEDNIIWHNRSFYVYVDDTLDPPFYGLIPDVTGVTGTVQPEAYWDLAVLGVDGGYLNPLYGILTSTTDAVLTADGLNGPIVTPTGYVYDISNLTVDPLFVAAYTNGAKNAIQQIETKSAIQIQPALDEGGNFIDVRFGPLTRVLETLDTATPAPNVISSTLIGDYHLDVGSPAIDVADAQASTDYTADLGVDFDGDLRPQGNGFDIGADEVK
jgi:hypothetical protein